MAYSTMAVANALVSRAKAGRLRQLTPMKLQKLLFFAQSWHLARNDGDPLIDEFFCRWQYGPVIVSLYHEFKCRVSCDHVPRRSMALFRAKAVLDELIADFPPRSPIHRGTTLVSSTA